MTDLPLPPLPVPAGTEARLQSNIHLGLIPCGSKPSGQFTAEQMQAYALAYGRMVADRCAEICESRYAAREARSKDWWVAETGEIKMPELECAAAIRANKEAT